MTKIQSQRFLQSVVKQKKFNREIFRTPLPLIDHRSITFAKTASSATRRSNHLIENINSM
jgi:hypothetical protein